MDNLPLESNAKTSFKSKVSSGANKINSGFNSSKNIISIIIGILLLACLIRVLSGNSSSLPTFSSLLSILEEAPNLKIPFLSEVITKLGDWGLFNFLRDFLQVILSIFDILIFLINGIINLMTYVVYFMRWLFLAF